MGEAQPDACGEDHLIVLETEDRIAEEAVSECHMPAQPLFKRGYGAQIEIQPVLSGVAQIRVNAKGLRYGGGRLDLVGGDHRRNSIPRSCVWCWIRRIPAHTPPRLESSARPYRSIQLSARGPAEYRAQAQALESVMLVFVDCGDKSLVGELAIICPSGADRTHRGTVNAMKQSITINLIQVHRDLVVSSLARTRAQSQYR
jgi:hypothetical protein